MEDRLRVGADAFDIDLNVLFSNLTFSNRGWGFSSYLHTLTRSSVVIANFLGLSVLED